MYYSYLSCASEREYWGLRWMTMFAICACPASPPVGSAGGALLAALKCKNQAVWLVNQKTNTSHSKHHYMESDHPSPLRNHKPAKNPGPRGAKGVGPPRTDYENKKKVRPSVSFGSIFWKR